MSDDFKNHKEELIITPGTLSQAMVSGTPSVKGEIVEGFASGVASSFANKI
jgi:hypothetical protein